MLNTVIMGNDTVLPPILIAHGLFGSARNWGVIAKRLSDTRRVLAVDMRNHGESGWMASHGYGDMADDLAEVIAAHGGMADVVGHSMGGKAAMALALLHKSAVRRLLVADISPVVYGHSQQHLVDAMRSVDLTRVVSRGDADRQLMVEIPADGVRAFLLQSLDIKQKNWRLNLDVLEVFMPQILGWPDLSGEFDGPVLFLSGARSDYVLPGHRDATKALFPNAKFAKIPDAGHWLHADDPRAFVATVGAFFGA